MSHVVQTLANVRAALEASRLELNDKMTDHDAHVKRLEDELKEQLQAAVEVASIFCFVCV